MNDSYNKYLAAAAMLWLLLPVIGSSSDIDEDIEAPKGIVDCLLPGALRRIGGSIYQLPGRPVRIIASECMIRGGDYLLFDRANYDTSLKHWITLAENDDVDAMLYVGEIYERGLGRDPDFEAAASWYRKAADAGNTTAMIGLAHLYKTGQGVDLSLEIAQSLYSQAFGSDIPVPLDPTSVKGADQRIQTLIAEVDEVRRQKVAVELELAAAKNQLQSARASLNDALAGDSGNADQVRALQQDVDRREAENRDYRARLDAMQAERDELLGLRQQLADQQLETARLKELLDAADANVAASRQQLSEQQDFLQQQESEFRELLANMSTEQDRVNLQASSNELDARRQRIEELEEALRKSEEEKGLYQALSSDGISNEDRIVTLTSRVSILEQQVLSKEAEFELMREELSDRRAELQRQAAEIAAAEQKAKTGIAERNDEIERLRAAVERAEQETFRHQTDIDKLAVQSAELEQLRANLEREQAQSNRLQQLLTESQDRFAESQHRLEEVSGAQASLVLEISSLKQRLAEGDLSAQDELSNRQQDLADAQQELALLKAQISKSEDEFRRYEVQVSDTAARQREAIQELRMAVAQSRAERSQLEEKLVSATAQIDNARADLELQRKRYTILQDELREVRAASDAGTDALALKQSELDEERQRRDRLEAEVERLTQQSQRYKSQLDELEYVAQAQKVEFAGPKIVLIEPDEASLLAAQPTTRATGQTRGISVVAAASVSTTKIIRGRVDAPAGLAELTIDGWDVNFDDYNAFTQTLKLDGQTKRIRVEAVDHNGKKDVKEFEYRVSGDTVATVHNKQARFDVSRSTKLDHLRYYALLIANEDYMHDDFARDLQTPVADVEAIGQILRERYGFEVKILRNADKKTLETEFERIFYHEESDDDSDNDKDGVLIYYAGHGLPSDSRTDNAYYWAPVDAVSNSPSTWFETRKIERYMKNSVTNQIMVVADSCFAGKVLSRDGEGVLPASENSRMFNIMLPEYTERKRSRFVLTSGGNAPVLDGGGGNHSVFASAFIDVLANNENIISAHTIFEHLAGKVIYLAEKQNFAQAPEFGHLRSAGHESGVFYLPAPLFPSTISATNTSL